ncbi:MAG: hypothetical protein ACE5H9_09070 [Anaerolineae bacterium]
MPEADFVRQTYQAMRRYDFNAENTIACVGLCRDEVTRSLIDGIQETWGEAFNFSSLAGMLFLGKTGFEAAHHHAPLMDGRERYVYFTMPHIAIGPQGEIGLCYRAGRAEASGACGALMAFRQEMAGGKLSLELDPFDLEQSLLKQSLFRKIEYGQVPDLVTLTRFARDVILEDLEQMVALTVDAGHSDYAIFSGVQIHGPEGKNYVAPGVMVAVVGGKREDITLPQPPRRPL